MGCNEGYINYMMMRPGGMLVYIDCCTDYSATGPAN